MDADGLALHVARASVTMLLFQIDRNIPVSRLGNSVTGFMISDESGDRFFQTAVREYWQDRAGIAY